MSNDGRVNFVPHADTRDVMKMLNEAIDGLGKVMDYDPLAPQALIAAETLLRVTKIPLEVREDIAS